jgi:hypothetical protein
LDLLELTELPVQQVQDRLVQQAAQVTLAQRARLAAQATQVQQVQDRLVQLV